MDSMAAVIFGSITAMEVDSCCHIFMLNALAVTSLYYSMGVASRTATPTSVYMHDIALTESSKHTWIFFTVICGRGEGEGGGGMR